MFFTQQDYIKIEKWLSDRGGKDSDFPIAGGLSGNEFTAIIQDNVNKRVTLKELGKNTIKLNITQDTGEDATIVMSQDAVTKLVKALRKDVTTNASGISGIEVRLGSGEKKLEDLDTVTKNNASNIQSNSDRITVVDKNVTSNTRSISNLANTVSHNTDSINNVKLDILEDRDNIQKNNDNIAINRANINKINSKIGKPNGIATLGNDGKIPETQLPSYVDEIIEGVLNSHNEFTATDGKVYGVTNPSGSAGKIFVDLDSQRTYRWSDTQFTEISASLALGETSETAWAGNKGKENQSNIAKHDIQIANLRTEFDTVARVYDGGRADSVYGGAIHINCGNANNEII